MKIHSLLSILMYCTALSFFYATNCMNKNTESCVTYPFTELIKEQDTIILDTIFPEDTNYLKEQINNIVRFNFIMKKATTSSEKNKVIFDIRLLEASTKKHYKIKLKKNNTKHFLWGLGVGGGIGIGVGVLLTLYLNNNHTGTNNK